MLYQAVAMANLFKSVRLVISFNPSIVFRCHEADAQRILSAVHDQVEFDMPGREQIFPGPSFL